jgi:hypothetical protein
VTSWSKVLRRHQERHLNEPQFQGHFPGMPIFPGVMIIEAMAQTSGVLVGLSMDLVDKNAKVFFMGVDGVKFRRKVVPGDVLELHVRRCAEGAGSGSSRAAPWSRASWLRGHLHGHVRRAKGLTRMTIHPHGAHPPLGHRRTRRK